MDTKALADRLSDPPTDYQTKHGLNAVEMMVWHQTCVEAARILRDVVPPMEAVVLRAKRLLGIVEGVKVIHYGTWRGDLNGVRLKDTAEWVELYTALAALDALDKT